MRFSFDTKTRFVGRKENEPKDLLQPTRAQKSAALGLFEKLERRLSRIEERIEVVQIHFEWHEELENMRLSVTVVYVRFKEKILSETDHSFQNVPFFEKDVISILMLDIEKGSNRFKDMACEMEKDQDRCSL